MENDCLTLKKPNKMITRNYILKSVEKSINTNGREHSNREVEKFKEFFNEMSDDEIREQLKEFDAIAQYLPNGFVKYMKYIF